MNTRMDRLRERNETASRVARNKELYERTIDTDIEKVNLSNNVSVLGSEDDIDINKLKEMISDRNPKRKEINYEDIDPEYEDIEKTKEYDLKKVIDEARNEQPVDYESTRFKKLHESEFDILKNLDFKKEEDTKVEVIKDDEKTLMDLIKTVNMNAVKRQSEKDDTLLSDLVGDDNTEVLDPISMTLTNTTPKPTLLEELEHTKQMSKLDIEELSLEDKEEPEEVEENVDEEELDETNSNLVNTFYTGNLAIKDNDLNDFKDLESELKSNSILIKILIIFVVIIILAMGVYLLNKYLNLGLF